MSEEKDILTFEIKNMFAGKLACRYDIKPALNWIELLFGNDDEKRKDWFKKLATAEKITAEIFEAPEISAQDKETKELIERARKLLFGAIEKTLSDALEAMFFSEIDPYLFRVSNEEIQEFMVKLGLEKKIWIAKGRPKETRGRKPGWNKSELENAIDKTLTDYRKKHYRAPTLQDMANALNNRYPSKPKFSGETLRKTLARYELDWIEIKNRNK